MKKRLFILVWAPVIYLVYFVGYLEIFLIFVIVLGIFEIFERREGDSEWSYVAILHISGLLCLLFLSTKEIIFLVLVVIANDSCAYVGGRYFNFWKKKIFPVTSPNKTWGGFIYGIILGATVGCVTARFLGFSGNYVYAALLICFLAVAGDYLESKFKRSLNLRDSGQGLFTEKLMFGHGGIYDRFDALALAAPGLLVLKGLFL